MIILLPNSISYDRVSHIDHPRDHGLGMGRWKYTNNSSKLKIIYNMKYVGKNRSIISQKDDMSIRLMNQASISYKKLLMTEWPTPDSPRDHGSGMNISSIEYWITMTTFTYTRKWFCKNWAPNMNDWISEQDFGLDWM